MLRAEGFSCSLDIRYGDFFAIFDQKEKKFHLHQNPGSIFGTGSVSESGLT
jgi:hypothetical protein